MDNCRLFVGGIPKTKKKDEIMEEMKKVTEGVVDVIVYPSAADKTKPGFHQFYTPIWTISYSDMCDIICDVLRKPITEPRI